MALYLELNATKAIVISSDEKIQSLNIILRGKVKPVSMESEQSKKTIFLLKHFSLNMF